MMRLRWMVCAIPLLVALSGCKRRDSGDAVGGLRSPNPEVRMEAARDLEGQAADGALPPHAIQALLQSAQTETDPRTKGAVMIALGHSGVAEAKPLLDQYVQTSDPDQRRWAVRALKKWVVTTGQYPQGYEFSESWPFDAPGFGAGAPPPMQQAAGMPAPVQAAPPPPTRGGPTPQAAPGAPPPSGGCIRDMDCKGDRVCEGGVCVTPQ
jgi:hypothetical protein